TARKAACTSGESTLRTTMREYATSNASWSATRPRRKRCSFGHHQPREVTSASGSPPASSESRLSRPVWSSSSRSGKRSTSVSRAETVFVTCNERRATGTEQHANPHLDHRRADRARACLALDEREPFERRRTEVRLRPDLVRRPRLRP